MSPPYAAHVGEGVEARAIRGAHGEHLAEFVIRHGHRETLVQCGPVFETGHANREIAACHGLFDGGPCDLHELGLTAKSMRDHRRDLHVEATHTRGIRRIRLDERRTTFRISTPSQRRARRDRGSGAVRRRDIRRARATEG